MCISCMYSMVELDASSIQYAFFIILFLPFLPTHLREYWDVYTLLRDFSTTLSKTLFVLVDQTRAILQRSVSRTKLQLEV